MENYFKVNPIEKLYLYQKVVFRSIFLRTPKSCEHLDNL